MMNLPNWVGNSQDATNWTGIRKCSLPFESEVYQQSGWTENRDKPFFSLMHPSPSMATHATIQPEAGHCDKRLERSRYFFKGRGHASGFSLTKKARRQSHNRQNNWSINKSSLLSSHHRLNDCCRGRTIR
jgi:hypothetical protein